MGGALTSRSPIRIFEDEQIAVYRPTIRKRTLTHRKTPHLEKSIVLPSEIPINSQSVFMVYNKEKQMVYLFFNHSQLKEFLIRRHLSGRVPLP